MMNCAETRNQYLPLKGVNNQPMKMTDPAKKKPTSPVGFVCSTCFNIRLPPFRTLKSVSGR